MCKFVNYIILILSLALVGCRKDVVVYPPETIPVGEPVHNNVAGMYLLNEGNMGSNKATLDYYDYRNATYTRNIYGFTNPNVVKELGDVGNDLKIYGSKLYAVINVSNKIEVMKAGNAVRLGQIEVPNCRFLCFKDGYGYVSSYAGPVQVGGDHAQIGYVAKFDTMTLRIVDTCLVGYQPDEMAIVGDRMYVANSGGYMLPNYEKELSVIDLTSFEEIGRIPVAVNLHQVRADEYGGLWVGSRGDYGLTPSRIYRVEAATQQVTDTIDLAAGSMWLDGDSLYVISSAYNEETYMNEVCYAIIDVRSHRIVTRQFVTDGTAEKIKTPYGIAVNPLTKDVFVTDAGNYVLPGMLYCYSKEGTLRWSVRTGDIPAHIVFLNETK